MRALLDRIRPWWQAIPQTLCYQVVTKLVLAAALVGLRRLAAWALASQGRVAVTSGDYLFLVTSWQGWVLLVLGLATLYAYVALDLNAQVAHAGHVVRGEPAPVMRSIIEGAQAIRRFACPQGVLVVLYEALLAPIVGVGMGISLTEGLRIPTFVSSVIQTTPTYLVAYTTATVAFGLLGLLGIFCIHGVVLSGESVSEARAHSAALMRAHWKDYLLQNLLFGLCMALASAAVMLLALALPRAAAHGLGCAPETLRLWTIFGCMAGIALGAVVGLLATPFAIIRLTQLYVGYLEGERRELPVRPPHVSRLAVAGVAVAFAGCMAMALVCNSYFDELFPATVGVRTIAHRGGGSEGPENTVDGLRAAARLGAWGSEIDIQRTADGAYVVNHDDSFERTTGDARTPGEMTLAEVRKLRVDGEPVATYEDMLDAARETGVVLFVELKGVSADRQMADDAVRIARERGMLDTCVFISLDYRLVDYLEGAYPEAQTGFLAWASYGDTAALNCDYLALEELSSTSDAIDAVHAQGKQIFVWTVNDRETQRRFLCSEADAIITDEVAQANEVAAELGARGDVERVMDSLLAQM